MGVVCDVLNKVSTSECSTIEDRAEVLSEFLERSGYSFPYNVDADSAFAEAGMRCDEGHTCLSFPAVYFACFKRFVAHIFLNGGKVPEPIQASADGDGDESNLDDVHRDPLLLRAVAQGAKSHILYVLSGSACACVCACVHVFYFFYFLFFILFFIFFWSCVEGFQSFQQACRSMNSSHLAFCGFVVVLTVAMASTHLWSFSGRYTIVTVKFLEGP